ncbi:2,3-butanediol dehydrogenase [Demequina sp.]|uniref:2,3-butanediol dehydrogenase n=1 Tax=Demequina sp. TaxID=2050685 RepID=UPI003A856E01
MPMKAVVLHGKEDVRIDELDIPTPGPGQVLVRNAYSGICGSDLHAVWAPESLGLSHDVPHPITGSTMPQVLGHEFSATVVSLGEGVEGLSVGDNAAVYPGYGCDKCLACLAGRPNACAIMSSLGLAAEAGGMSEYAVIDAHRLHVLPEGIDLKMGALVEPMAVAWHAVQRAILTPDSTVLIAGAGPIGIGLFFALKARGITKVLVSEPSDERRALIASFGAKVMNPITADLQAEVLLMSDGLGADATFDAAGVAPAFQACLDALGPTGRLVVVAIHEQPMQVPGLQLNMGEIDIVGAMGYLPEDFDAVIQAMADGVYITEGWVSVTDFDGVMDAMEGLRKGQGAKVLVSARGLEDTAPALEAAATA